MKRVAVLTDSSSDLDLSQAEQLGLQLILLAVNFDGRRWFDHADLDSDLIFKRISEGAKIPEMQLPTPDHYLGVIDNLLRRHDHVIALHSSPLIGRVHSFALRALEAFPHRERVTLVNSGTTSAGLALLARRAAALCAEGQDPAEIAQILHNAQAAQCSQLTVSTLEYLRRAKLISAASAMIGEIQERRPVFSVREGRLEPVATVRGDNLAQQLMIETLRERARNFPGGQIAYVSNGDPEVFDALRAEAVRLGIQEIMHARLGAVISSFAGPDAYGFTFEPIKVWHRFRSF